MTVGRVTFGSNKNTAQTVLGGAVEVQTLPWVLGAVVLIVALILISSMNGQK